MNVLSLFDGISCGQLALERAGIPVENYFASEIDKYAIQITQKHYPKTIQLGDVNNWINWNLPKIDLLIGGPPCQGFSVSGKHLNFSDPRSQLFFRYLDCLKWYKPSWFLLENVKMKKDIENIISEYMNIQPIRINSALVSAQNRVRLYWTNILDITQPKDKQILLKDIIENGSVDREKSYCIDANYFKGSSIKMYQEKKRRQIVNSNLHCIGVFSDADRPKGNYLPRERVFSVNGKARAVSTEFSQHPYYDAFHQSEKRLMVQVGSVFENNAQAGRIYSVDGKSVTLNANGGGMGGKTGLYQTTDKTFRKLTPLECERLQTLPDNYTEGISNTQRYKTIGNGWTVDVIVHILKALKEKLL